MEMIPEVEWEMFMCLKLGWKSISRMRKGLSNMEYEKWLIFFQREKQNEELAAKGD